MKGPVLALELGSRRMRLVQQRLAMRLDSMLGDSPPPMLLEMLLEPRLAASLLRLQQSLARRRIGRYPQ